MFVHKGPLKIPVEPVAAVGHRAGQGDGFRIVQPIEEGEGQPCSSLGTGNAAIGYAGHKSPHLFGGQGPPGTLLAEDVVNHPEVVAETTAPVTSHGSVKLLQSQCSAKHPLRLPCQ